MDATLPCTECPTTSVRRTFRWLDNIAKDANQVDTETQLQDDQVQARDARRMRKRSPVKSWGAVLIAMAAISGGWWLYLHRGGNASPTAARHAAQPEVTVSRPLG